PTPPLPSTPTVSSSDPHRTPPDLHSFPTRRSSDLSLSSTISCMYFEKSRTTATLQHWPASDVPPPRARIGAPCFRARATAATTSDRKSTRLNSSHRTISYAVFCLKKKQDPPTSAAH